MFDSIADKGMSVCADAAGFKRWLDDAEVNARNSYLAYKNPAWDGIMPAVDSESGEAWLEPGEATLLSEKSDYEKNLRYLHAWFPTRKQLWQERYARPARPNQESSTTPAPGCASERNTERIILSDQRGDERVAHVSDVLIDMYLSDLWRIHGGPEKKSDREELRDLLIPAVIRAFGSVEASLDVLLKESPCSNGHRINPLIHAYELYFLRRTREAVEAGDATAELRCAEYTRKFAELKKYETEKFGKAVGDDEKIHATLRTNVCYLPRSDRVPAPAVRREGMGRVVVTDNIRVGEPLTENVPENDSRHDGLAPYFEVMEQFQVLADEYPAVSIDWHSEIAKWMPWPPPARVVRDEEVCPSSPGSDLHIETTADKAGRLLLDTPESWFNSSRDPWLDIDGAKPWERWFYAIREFWLNAGEEAEDQSADTGEFEKAAEAMGYLPTHNPKAVGERVWRKMLKSKIVLRDSLHELGLSAADEVARYEEAAGWIQTGRIEHAFRACAYFCGVLAARRAGQSVKVGAAELVGRENGTGAKQDGGEHDVQIAVSQFLTAARALDEIEFFDLSAALQPIADAASTIGEVDIASSAFQAALEATACALEGIDNSAITSALQSLEAIAGQISFDLAQIGANVQALQDAGAHMLEAIDAQDLDGAFSHIREAARAAEALSIGVQPATRQTTETTLPESRRLLSNDDPLKTPSVEALLPERPTPGTLIDEYLDAHPEIPNHDALAEKIGISRDVLFAIKSEARWARPIAYRWVASLIGCAEQDLQPRRLPRRRRKGKSNQKSDSKSD
jgi:hypothetical protein